MKKLFVVLGVCGLCACSSVNKNTVSYQMGKYDQGIYYVVSGEGADKELAAENALENMRQNIVQNVPDVEFALAQVDDLLANAKTGKVWRDKSAKDTKRYLALAVLKREVAEDILQLPANELDGRLAVLSRKLDPDTDKFAGLRAAFSMEPLIVKRNVLEDLYIFVSRGHEGYETGRFDSYKKAYNDRLAAVKVAVSVQGEENALLRSRVTDALNGLGLSVAAPEDETALLAVEVDAQVDGYSSDRIKGLEWASTSAAVNLHDLQNNSTFSSFTVHDRVGTGRQSEALRKSMEGVGDKASAEIVKRLTEYLKTK